MLEMNRLCPLGTAAVGAESKRECMCTFQQTLQGRADGTSCTRQGTLRNIIRGCLAHAPRKKAYHLDAEENLKLPGS